MQFVKDPYSKYNLIKRLILEVILPHWRPIIIAILLMLLISFTVSFQALLIQPAIDSTLFSSSEHAKKILQQVSIVGKIKEKFHVSDREYLLYLMPILVVITCFIRGFATFFQLTLSQITTTKLNNDLRNRLYKRFLFGDIEEFANQSSGKMISNIIFDINGMIGAINLILSGVFKQFFTLLLLIGVMFITNFKLAIIAFTVVPFAIYPIYKIYRSLNKHMNNNQEHLELFTVLIDDSLRAIRVVKAYNAEEYELSRLKKALNSMLSIATKVAKTANITSPLNETLLGISIGLVLFYGGNMVLSGEATPGSFFAFFAALMNAYKPAKSVGGINVQMHLCLITARRVFEILDTPIKIVDSPNAKKLENCKGNIELDNVKFGYINERAALNNISFNVEAGKTYALVGHSGAGKSTIFNMLLRFYDPESGSIKIDGHDIREYTIHSLRDNISYVSQDIQLFDTTVYDNIAYGNQNANELDVIKAAKLAEAHDFIEEMPEKYQTQVGQNGQKLSGGQRQRIALARAFIRNCPILLLDEATSALDPTSETLIQKALTKLMVNRTTLIIAHRLSTVINADKIIVMSKGKVLEIGDHKTLLANNGEYANLYKNQFAD